jgi:hypothetical protein
MSDEKRVEAWEDCEAELRAIMQANEKSIIGVWFRGQANAEWPLESTLERKVGDQYALSDYYELIHSIKPAVETFTNSSWDLPDDKEIAKWATTYDERAGSWRSVLAYDYLAHLRHNGFPSPLLDWSRSPYVAAFFAFSKPVNEDVAIYAYAGMPENSKIGSSNAPRIDFLGPLVKTHKRHFRQQSAYTICTQYENGSWYVVKHQSVFDLKMPKQDLLWKITIPASERMKVLSALSLVNINAFSLFDTEETLMEMLAFEHLELARAERGARRAERAEKAQTAKT